MGLRSKIMPLCPGQLETAQNLAIEFKGLIANSANFNKSPNELMVALMKKRRLQGDRLMYTAFGIFFGEVFDSNIHGRYFAKHPVFLANGKLKVSYI